MTEKQKKIVIIAGVLIVALILLLFRKSGGTNNIINNQQGAGGIDVSIPNVTIPSLNIPQRSPIAINIPGLPSASPYDFNAISPCMCNGAGVAAPITGQSAPLIGYTINEGNNGPNIYNYYTPAPIVQQTTPQYTYTQHTFAEAHGL